MKEQPPEVKKAAVALGRLGGLRKAEMTEQELEEASKNAAIIGRLGGLKRGRAWQQMSEAERIKRCRDALCACFSHGLSVFRMHGIFVLLSVNILSRDFWIRMMRVDLID